MRKPYALLFTSVIAIAHAGSAQAQSGQSDAPRSLMSSGVATIDEIIVTARKREERLQDVPLAISAYSGTELQRNATRSLQDLSERTPQLVIGQSPNGGVINLRGVGAASNVVTVDQSVSINIDGIQVSQPQAIQLGLYDLNRIEILKGPQALFYGKSSPAGVISLVSADPSDRFEWRLRTGYEFENKQRLIDGAVSIPLTSTLGLRLAGAYSNQDGWFKNIAQPQPGDILQRSRTFPSQREVFVRGTLKYESPNERFGARLKVSYLNRKQRTGNFSSNQPYSCPLGVLQNSIGTPGATSECKLDRYYIEPNLTPEIVAIAPDLFGDGQQSGENKQTLAVLTLDYKLTDQLTLTSVSGYYKSGYSGITNGSFADETTLSGGADVRVKQFTQELRLASKFDGPVNFVGGAYYQNAVSNISTLTILSGPVATLFGLPGPTKYDSNELKQHTHAYSFFGQVIYDITPVVQLTAGARYSHEWKSADILVLPGLTSGFQTIPVALLDSTVRFNNISPEATLSYHPNSNLNFYASYRTGFTSGGFNLSPGSFVIGKVNDQKFNQATVKGFEGGVKAGLFNNQLKFDFSAYRYEYKNLQLSEYSPLQGTITVRNAGAATVKGLELSTTLSPAPIQGLSLFNAIAYNDARYASYANAGCYTGQTIAQGCNGNFNNGVASTQDLTGRTMPRAPRWSLQFGGRYERHIGNNLQFALSAEANYKGKYQSDEYDDPRAVQAETWRFNATIGLGKDDGGWNLSLIGKNLTNELRVANTFAAFGGFGTGTAGPALLADLTGTVTEPRTVMLQLTLNDALLR